MVISFSRLSVGRSPFNESAKISEGAPFSFPRSSWLNQIISPPFSVAALTLSKKNWERTPTYGACTDRRFS